MLILNSDYMNTIYGCQQIKWFNMRITFEDTKIKEVELARFFQLCNA